MCLPLYRATTPPYCVCVCLCVHKIEKGLRSPQWARSELKKPWKIELIDKWKYIQWQRKYILGWENICAKVCQHLAFGGLETTLSKFEHRLLATTVAKKPRTETKIWIFPKMWITYKHIYMYVIVLYSLSIATTGGKNADRETKICQNVTTNMLNRILWKWI